MPLKELPLYLTIKTSLLDDIKAGRFANGDMLPSQKEMSQRYGVSLGTVARAVSELTKEGVLESHARSAVRVANPLFNQTKNITYLVHNPGMGEGFNPFTHVINGISNHNHFQEYDFNIKRALVVDETVKEGLKHGKTFRDYLNVEHLRGHNVDGLVVMNVMDLEYLAQLKTLSYPTVVLDRDTHDIGLDCVIFDNMCSSLEMTRKFLDAGHKNIGFLGKILPTSKDNQRGYDSSTGERRLGYEMAIKSKGLQVNPKNIFHAKEPKFNTDVEENLKALLQQGKDITALICDFGYEVQIRKVLSSMGRENIELAGWHWGVKNHQKDYQGYKYITFFDLDEMALAATNLLHERMSTTDQSLTRTLIPGTIYEA